MVDSYGAFFDQAGRPSTDLAEWLRDQGATSLYVMGLPTEYGVRHTVLGALSLGYETHLLTEGCRGVNAQAAEDAVAEMRAAGALIE